MNNQFFEIFLGKIKKPFFLIKYIFFSVLVYILLLAVNLNYILERINEYYQINNRYNSELSQYSLIDPYQSAVEIVSNIYNYEFSELKKTFAAEIWTSNKHLINDFPKFSPNSFNFYDNSNKQKVINSLNKNNNYFFLYSNNQVYVGVVIFFRIKRVEENFFYKIVFYKKMLDFDIINKFSILRYSFISASILLILLIFVVLIIFVSFPFISLEMDKDKRILRTAIVSIKNLISHSLINQENILRYGDDIDEKISKSLLHNIEAQNLLDNLTVEEIEIENFLKQLIMDVYIPENINVFCKLNTKNNILFSKSLLLLSFSTVIHNATHSEVLAKNIYINIYQKKFSKRIFIEISNDGVEIKKGIRKLIFSGITTKKNGNGSGLKNLKNLMNEAGSQLKLLKKKTTTFLFNVKASNLENYLEKQFKLEKPIKNKLISTKNEVSTMENLPLVVIIEDEKQIWNGWKINMTDANLLFFANPDEFFYHTDIEKYHNREFISKIDMIICDFDFGNNLNLSNSCFFESLEKETEKLKGYFILCSGFNQSIVENIPKRLRDKIDLILQKRPTSYNEIMKKIQNKK